MGWVENKPVDALSHKVSLLQTMSIKVTGFERLTEDYETCLDFREVYAFVQSD